jgi:hypothetical protein
MLQFADLLSSQPGVRISLDIPTKQAVDMMAKALERILQSSGCVPGFAGFKSFAIVSGLPGSCRVIMDRPFRESVPLSRPLNSQGLALEFLTELYIETRFPPEPTPTPKPWSRCYEVRSISMDGHLAAFVLAGWMQNP